MMIKLAVILLVSTYLFLQNTSIAQAGGANILCPNPSQINTAIGCIPYADITAFSAFFLVWGLGIGGGIAFLLMVYAGFMIITSSGNPQRLEAGKELLTSAISGLLLLVFSVFILRVVGVNILQIPGL